MPTWVEKINLKKGLSAVELEKSLENEKFFGGIIKLEDLENIIINSYPISFVAFHKKHWIAIYLSRHALEVFDSGAVIWRDPPDAFISFLCLHSNKQIRFNKRMQNNEFICGLYSIFFIKLKSKMWKWKKIINFLKNQKCSTDSLIRKLFRCET